LEKRVGRLLDTADNTGQIEKLKKGQWLIKNRTTPDKSVK
jgi:hypothetical protein